MGFFDLFKKNVTCARCGASISTGDAKTLNGKQYCPNCYRRLQQASQPTRSSGYERQGSSGPENGSFEGKYGDKYGKGGSTGSTGSSGRSNDSFSGSSGRSGGSSGCPASIADIRRVLDETKTKYRENNNGKQWEIETGFTGKEKNYMIKFISTGDDTLAVRVFALLSAEKSQYPKIYPVLNKLQDQFRFLRFTLDRDGDINVEYDATCCDRDAGMVAMEMIIRITKILDEAYPELKRAVYL